jgi:chaperonin cofactor prefoldin
MMNLRPLLHLAPAIALSLLVIGASPAVAEVLLEPGETERNVAADDSSAKCNPTNCEVSFDLEASTLFLNVKSANEEDATASATLLSTFAISAEGTDPSDETPLLGSTLSLTVDATGALDLDGADSVAGYRLDVVVTDTDGSNPIAAAKVAEGAAIDKGEIVDISEMVIFNLNLTRGHKYQVELTLSLFALAGPQGIAEANFGGSSASWQDLTITAGADVLGGLGSLEDRVSDLEDDVALLDVRVSVLETRADVVEARVDVLDDRVDDLDVRVDDLQDQVDGIEGDLEDLTEAFENHTHEYLTGRGNGHNNTTATTTVPDEGASIDPIEDDDDEGASTDPVEDDDDDGASTDPVEDDDDDSSSTGNQGVSSWIRSWLGR